MDESDVRCQDILEEISVQVANKEKILGDITNLLQYDNSVEDIVRTIELAYTDNNEENVFDVEGVGILRGHFLIKNGYKTPSSIANMPLSDLTSVKYIGEQSAPQIINSAEEVSIVDTNKSSQPSQATSNKEGTSAEERSIKPYSEIAAEFPEPAKIVPEQTTSTGPEIRKSFTIPGSHISPEKIPWNSDDVPWRIWRTKFTTTSALYILAARHAASDTNRKRAVHAVFSPQPGKVQSHNAATTLRAKAAELAQDVNIRGGMIVFHGYRIRDDVREKFREQISNTEYASTATDVLRWEWIRRGNWRKYVEWGPHYHIIGLSESMTKYRGDGVLVQLREFRPYDDLDDQTVVEHRSVAKDIIDHLTFHRQDPSHPITWFGELEGSVWWSAKEVVDEDTLETIRSHLIDA